MGGFGRKSGKAPIAVVLKLSPSVCTFAHLQCLAGRRYSTSQWRCGGRPAQRHCARRGQRRMRMPMSDRYLRRVCSLHRTSGLLGKSSERREFRAQNSDGRRHAIKQWRPSVFGAAIARRGVRPSFRSVRPGYVRVRIARRDGQLGPLGWGGGGSRGDPAERRPNLNMPLARRQVGGLGPGASCGN
jgi:hypothetical protein